MPSSISSQWNNQKGSEFVFLFLKNRNLFNRLFLTMVLLFVFRAMSQIPLPYVDKEALKEFTNNPFMEQIGQFSGGALANFTIMAMGISSYITASIIIQLFTFQIPFFHEISRAPSGKKTIQKMTIVLGIIISFVSSLIATKYADGQFLILHKSNWGVFLTIAIIHAIGTGIAIYMGEMITEKGFGNGFSLLIFCNILSGAIFSFSQKILLLRTGEMQLLGFLPLIALVFGIIAFVVLFEKSVLSIPIIYAKNKRNFIKNFYKEESAMPIKLNLVGVMPIILASAFFQLLSFGLRKIPSLSFLLDPNSIPYMIASSLFIFIFSIFYTNLLLSEQEISENIQSMGAIIRGVRPGNDTLIYVRQVKKAMGLFAGMYLMLLSAGFSALFSLLHIQTLPATSFMILTTVSLEVCKSIQTEYNLLNYKKI